MTTVKWLRNSMAQRRLLRQAAEFLTNAAVSGPQDRAAFAAWLLQSPRHVKAYLLTWAIDREMCAFLRRTSGRRLTPQTRLVRAARSKPSRYALIGLAASLAVAQVVQFAHQRLPTRPGTETRAVDLSASSARLFFNGETLIEAAARFNRRNAVQIVIDDPEAAGMRISGMFPADEPENFVAVLNETDGLITDRKKTPTAHLVSAAYPRPAKTR